MNQLELKFRGMSLSAEKNKELLERARDIARMIGLGGREISINDIRDAWPSMPSGNWIGSIFKDEFEPCGFEEARHEKSHGRIVRKWKLK